MAQELRALALVLLAGPAMAQDCPGQGPVLDALRGLAAERDALAIALDARPASCAAAPELAAARAEAADLAARLAAAEREIVVLADRLAEAGLNREARWSYADGALASFVRRDEARGLAGLPEGSRCDEILAWLRGRDDALEFAAWVLDEDGVAMCERGLLRARVRAAGNREEAHAVLWR